jgi:hypothetical protein
MTGSWDAPVATSGVRYRYQVTHVLFQNPVEAKVFEGEPSIRATI